MIRAAEPSDIPSVVALVIAARMFEPGDDVFLAELFDDYFNSGLAGGHAFVVDEDASGIQGMAYYQPKQAADRVWDLTMIAVQPGRQGHGLGGRIITHVEEVLRHQGQRLLIVETSATPQYDLTRNFYARHGYDEEARVRDYWTDNDDLVLFRKRLTSDDVD